MLAYLVLTGIGGAPVDEETIRRFDRDDLPEIPFQPDARIVWRNHDGSVVFFGWQAFAEVAGIGSHWTVDAGGLTAFTGHCWPRDTGWTHGADRSWAALLRAYLGDSPDPTALRESLFGHFTIVSLSTADNGWVMPDWASVDQLYVAETPSGTAVSNRAGLCARAVSPANAAPPRSLVAAGWVVGLGWIIDQESGYWEVERPRAGSLVAIEPRRGAEVVAPPVSALYPREPEDPAPTYEELLSEVERDLRGTIRAVAELPVADRVLSLSGGKDSRTLLAVILSEGVQDRFRFETSGSPQRADAILAQTFATRFGLDWSLHDPSGRPPEAELDNLLMHVYLAEGMTSAWSVSARPTFSPGVAVNGTSGEGLRWGKVSSSGVGARTVEEVVGRVLAKDPFDPLGLLRPEVRAYYVDFLTGWFHEQVDLGIPLISVPALYFHETRMHARAGPDAVWNPRLRVDPYMTPVCIRATHRLPLDRRPDLRFHLDLQRRCCPELSTFPLTGTAWTEAMYGQLPDAADYRSIEPMHTRDPQGRTWRVKHYDAYRSAIEQAVLERGNPIHELLDRDRMLSRLAKGGEHEGRARLVWGLLSAAAWTGQHERPVTFTRG
ncbi:MAG TPA: hypothetical protein VFP05_02140 [Thermomicrobiales bacterium]|nr:hypothetical protein [Thermomicrobiales bacterium]